MPSIYVKKYPDGRHQNVACEWCRTTFSVTNRGIARGQGRFCSRVCHGASRRRRITLECDGCHQSFEVTPVNIRNGARFCSWACRVVGFRGEGNPNYNGDPEYRGWDWDEARLKALERDAFQCRRCGSTERLHVHHIVEWKETQDNGLENLETLCTTCHFKHHRRSVEAERRQASTAL